MNLKDFINTFDLNHPVWIDLPEGFPACRTDGLSSQEIGMLQAIKSLWELARPVRPASRSRVWKDPAGYQYLGVWQNAALLRVLVRKFTLTLPLNPTLKKPLEYRLKAQLDDAARSVKRNIEEGWKRPTTREYLDFLGYSQASLEEVRGDMRDCKTDGFIRSVPGSTLRDIGIDVRVFKGPDKGQVKGEPTDPGHPYCQPLAMLNPKTLTFEIFLELTNKTDYLLRCLVSSLENKMNRDIVYYQVDKARVGRGI